MSKATPGPWEALPWEQDAGGKDWIVWGPRPTNHPGDDNLRGEYGSEADANLIAAAPDLLAAAKAALNFIANTEGELDIILDSGTKLRAAIAKAEGREP